MGWLDWILILVIGGAVVLALRSMKKSRKNGSGCTGCCASCGHRCERK